MVGLGTSPLWNWDDLFYLRSISRLPMLLGVPLTFYFPDRYIVIVFFLLVVVGKATKSPPCFLKFQVSKETSRTTGW